MIDISNKKFGRLTAIRPINSEKWLFRCDCGKEKIINSYDVRIGKTQSCGCLQKERTSKANSKHKARGTRLYNIWLGMRNRCNCKSHVRYHRYGGRGIKVCEEWNDFLKFKEWALNNGYRENLTIDRIDNNGNYEPSNCRWVTPKEQFLNSNVSQEFKNHMGFKNCKKR